MVHLSYANIMEKTDLMLVNVHSEMKKKTIQHNANIMLRKAEV